MICPENLVPSGQGEERDGDGSQREFYCVISGRECLQQVQKEEREGERDLGTWGERTTAKLGVFAEE